MFPFQFPFPFTFTSARAGLWMFDLAETQIMQEWVGIAGVTVCKYTV